MKGGAVKKMKPNVIPGGIIKVWLGGIPCGTGREEHLGQCRHTRYGGVTRCRSDAFVKCSKYIV